MALRTSGLRALGYVTAIFVVLAAIIVTFTVVRPIGPYIREGLDLKGGVEVVLRTERPVTAQEMQIIQAILTNRADSLGVSEPIIQQQGSREMVVQVPGVKNQEAAIKTIGETGQLEFEGPKTVTVGKTKTNPGTTEQVPDGKPFLTGKDVTSANAIIDSSQGNSPAVTLTFNAAGSAAMNTFTSAHIGDTMYTLLDGKVINTATVDGAISGTGEIYGLASLQSAQQLATLINSGSLPVALKTIEVEAVSASLGAASVHASEVAGVLAMLLIVLLMIFFYRFAGVLADIALLLYIMVLGTVLILLHAVITLPSVAGVILSAGIAVDANVIIFARLRDELRFGRSFSSAVDFGFRNALRAIADSNVSTIVASIVLYYFGTGDVRGFALTLGLGVAISFLTAYFFTRLLIRMVQDSTLTDNLGFFVGYRALPPAAKEAM
jgi:preprotein translocase subunit SecD